MSDVRRRVGQLERSLGTDSGLCQCGGALVIEGDHWRGEEVDTRATCATCGLPRPTFRIVEDPDWRGLPRDEDIEA